MRRFKPPIQVMTAPDMFNPDLKQRFNKKTGERIDYGYSDLFEIEEPEVIVPLDEIFTQQLTLF